MPPWSPGDVVIVLGAGATRGAQFVVDGPGHPAGCLPPLNADFFTQLQRLQDPAQEETVRGVVGDVVKLFGPNFSLTLEEYFTELEAMLTMVDVPSCRKLFVTTRHLFSSTRSKNLRHASEI